MGAALNQKNSLNFEKKEKKTKNPVKTPFFFKGFLG